jgi:hypothetical protein
MDRSTLPRRLVFIISARSSDTDATRGADGAELSRIIILDGIY